MSYRKLRLATVLLLVAFVVLSTGAGYLAFNVPEFHVQSAYATHEPIHIEGNDGLASLDEAVNGVGTQDDPYVIEWLEIVATSTPCIQLNGTDAYVVIRHCWFDAQGYRAESDSPVGIQLSNATHVRVEDSMFNRLGAGLKADGPYGALSADITASNCIFEDCWDGISASNLSGLNIESCYAAENRNSAILLDHCLDCDVAFSRIESSGRIAVSNCTSIRISDNHVYNGAVYVADTTNLLFSNSTLYPPSISGWGYRSSMNVARASAVSVISNSIGGGAHFKNSDSCTITRNRYGGLSTYYLANSSVVENVIDGGDGFYMRGSENCLVSGNILLDSDGLFFRGNYSVLSKNVLMGGWQGGISVNGNNLTVEENIVHDIYTYHGDDAGIYAYGCNNLSVIDNSVWNVSNRYGEEISLELCSNVVFARNNVSGEVRIFRLDNVTFHSNSFRGTDDGYYDHTYWGLDNVTFVLNSFLNVSFYQMYTTTVIWNEEYPVGGNYWSSYVGVDEYSGIDQDVPGADGIGDEPYTVPSSLDVDYYPFMQPIAIHDLSAPVTYSSISGTVGDMGWYRSNLSITLNHEDAWSGVETTNYRLDGGPWRTYTSAIQVTGDGAHTLEFYSVDSEGNAEGSKYLDLRIDTEGPMSVEGTRTEYSFTETTRVVVSIEFTDNLSGLSDISVFVDPEALSYYSYGGPFAPPKLEAELYDGLNTIRADARDRAGNHAVLVISVDASINYNREPLSLTGPYGPLLVIALVVDIGLLIALASFWNKLREPRPGRPWIRGDRESWERDKVYDVEDGYTKFIKKQ